MNSLKTFTAQANEVRKISEYFDSSRGLLTRYSRILEKNSESRYYFDDNCSSLREIEIRDDTVWISLSATLWGSFENFVRESLKEAVEDRNEKGWNTEQRETITNQNTLSAANLFNDRLRGKNIHNCQPSAISNSLPNLYKSGTDFKVNGDIASAIGGSFEHDDIRKYGERIGVDLSWSTLGGCEALQIASGKSANVPAGEWAKVEFCAIRDRRNLYVHRGPRGNTCTKDDLSNTLKVLEAIATSISLQISQ